MLGSICRNLFLSILSLFLLGSFGFAQNEDPFLATSVDSAAESVIEQLQQKLEDPSLLGDVPLQQIAILNIHHRSTKERWELSRVLENHIAEALTQETSFSVVHPQKVNVHLRTFWKELLKNQHYPVALKIAKDLKAPLVFMGSFEVSGNRVDLQIQLLRVRDEILLGTSQVHLAQNTLDPNWLKPLPIYKNKAKLEIARALIVQKNWDAARAELESVEIYPSEEGIEAQALLIWIQAKQGYSVEKKFTRFQILHPNHPFVAKIKLEQERQQRKQQFEELIEQEAWIDAWALFQNNRFFYDRREEQKEYQERWKKHILSSLHQQLEQKSWRRLDEQWQIVVSILENKFPAPFVDFRLNAQKQFALELEQRIESRDRAGASDLLSQLGSAFLSESKIRIFQQSVDKIPLPPSQMVTLPSLRFFMGNPQGHLDEQPYHQVFVPAFHLDQYEVSNENYQECVDAKACKASGSHADIRFNDKTQPVVNVSWFQAQDYCQWKKKRLPTEAEWERATVTEQPLSGEMLSRTAWFQENSNQRTRPIGLLRPNRYGLFDMLGNALEWVSDHYAVKYYSWSPIHAPTGPERSFFRVARGGAWLHEASDICPSCRFFWSPKLRFNFIGFRCAAALE